MISVQRPVVVKAFGRAARAVASLDDIPSAPETACASGLGRAALQRANEAETPIRLDEGTALIFPAPEPEKSFLLKLI